jgi:hypothetical protein
MSLTSVCWRRLRIGTLGRSGWANSYYSAAVQAGSQSWKAWFFGSFDSSSFISVDKSPASLWVMGLSARLFGVNAWSILVPQALEGIAAVALLYAAIRRWFGPVAALMAGAVLALSPAAALMFRFNNPDALLVLFLVAGAYSLTRALESGSTKWLLLAFSFVGFGFLAKMLQALLVVPAFGAVYLFAGPPMLGKRVRQLALGAVAMLVSAAGGSRCNPRRRRRFYIADRRTTACEPDVRLQRLRPLDRRRPQASGRTRVGGGARPGSFACSPTRSRRSRGCCPALIPWRPCSPERTPHRPTRRIPLVGGGCSSPSPLSLGQAGHHPPYTRSPPAIGPSSAGAVVVGVAKPSRLFRPRRC